MPLEPPPLDESGNVVPHDHTGITASDGIIRRISENQVVIDGQGNKRISSKAFQPSSGNNAGMSVDLQASIVEAGLDPKNFVTTPRWTGSVRFVAGSLRNEGFQVGFHPIPDNPHHGEAWGEFSKPKKRRLQELCEWFVPIAGVSTKPI